MKMTIWSPHQNGQGQNKKLGRLSLHQAFLLKSRVYFSTRIVNMELCRSINARNAILMAECTTGIVYVQLHLFQSVDFKTANISYVNIIPIYIDVQIVVYSLAANSERALYQ